MAKKIIVTRAEIEKDISAALRHPADMSKRSYDKMTIPAILIAVVALVAEFVYPLFVVWLLSVFFALIILCPLIVYVRRWMRSKRVTLDDYEVSYDTVHSTREENYRSGRRRKIHVFNYYVHFESGRTWCIPQDNYLWSEERPMSKSAIFESTHRGDQMIVITKKETQEIVMAYSAEFFEYKS